MEPCSHPTPFLWVLHRSPQDTSVYFSVSMPPTSSSSRMGKGLSPGPAVEKGFGKVLSRAWGWVYMIIATIQGLAWAPCLSVLGFKSAGPGFGSPGMTADGWEVGQKMKLERKQARLCRDPKSRPQCLDSVNRWDLGAPSQGLALSLPEQSVQSSGTRDAILEAIN